MARVDPAGRIAEGSGRAMKRLPITSKMAKMITARIASLPRDAPEVDGAWALPLYSDIGGVIGIRPDGTLVEWTRDGGGRDVRPVDDRIWVLIALVAGARRYPELQPLLPVRRPGAVDCVCRTIPKCVSGLIYCGQCGGMGWLATGESGPSGRLDRPRRASPLVRFVFGTLAMIAFYGAFAILGGAARGFFLNGLGLIVLGILSLVVAIRGIGPRRPGRSRIARGPTFAADDPEVAALPPTSMTHISEQIRQARERQKREQD
jgi:hypothetical protein